MLNQLTILFCGLHTQWDSCMVVSCISLPWVDNEYKFLLPIHKADTNFEGNQVHITCIINMPDPQLFMMCFVASCDFLFLPYPHLWLYSNSTVQHTPGELSQGAGHWSSDAFKWYIQKNVIVLHMLILSQLLHYLHSTWPVPDGCNGLSLFSFTLLICALLWTVFYTGILTSILCTHL